MLRFLKCLKTLMYRSEGPLNAKAPKSSSNPMAFAKSKIEAMEEQDCGERDLDVAGMERKDKKM
jgi:hypothetical protein